MNYRRSAPILSALAELEEDDTTLSESDSNQPNFIDPNMKVLEHEASQSRNSYSYTVSSLSNPYQDVNIAVRNYSFNNQGIVMYHVDIKGPEGILSTYTIRRRYRAFKDLYDQLCLFLETSTGKELPKQWISGQYSLKHNSTFTKQQFNLNLPSLPSAGMWSYIKRHDIRLVEQRKRQLEEILRVAICHPILRTCPALDAFLSVAPSEISQRGSSYVSLQDYSVPVLDHHRESIERKQRKLQVLQGKKRTRAMSMDISGTFA